MCHVFILTFFLLNDLERKNPEKSILEVTFKFKKWPIWIYISLMISVMNGPEIVACTLLHQVPAFTHPSPL